ncbi:MAG: hypothetical protein H3C48_07715 [Chitinophagaceae bacterium]|nr:hypothetical protein [Chitinophagaceae bacterium]
MTVIPIVVAFSVLYNYWMVDWKVDAKKDVAVIGTSVPTYSYNVRLIGRLANLGMDAETYFYNYYKLQPFLKKNPQVKTLLIEFDNRVLEGRMNDWIWGDRWLPDKVGKYALYIDGAGYRLLLKQNPKTYKLMVPFIKSTFKISLKTLIRGRFYTNAGLGGYYPRYQNNMKRILSKLSEEEKTGFPKQEDYREMSQVNIDYLHKLIKFCKLHNVKVFLLRTPMHKWYEGYKYEDAFQQFYKDNFAGVEFLDFKNFPMDDSEFSDLSHMNYKGSERYSKWFNSLLNDGLLERKNKQEFIDNHIALLKK